MRSMSNNELHLFVFEGARAESKYVDKLEQHFLGKRISVKCVYDAEIYQLYKQLKAEEFAFDMVNLLKERSKENKHHFRETIGETHPPQMSGSGRVKCVSCLRFGLLRG